MDEHLRSKYPRFFFSSAGLNKVWRTCCCCSLLFYSTLPTRQTPGDLSLSFQHLMFVSPSHSFKTSTLSFTSRCYIRLTNQVGAHLPWGIDKLWGALLSARAHCGRVTGLVFHRWTLYQLTALSGSEHSVLWVGEGLCNWNDFECAYWFCVLLFSFNKKVPGCSSQIGLISDGVNGLLFWTQPMFQSNLAAAVWRAWFKATADPEITL